MKKFFLIMLLFSGLIYAQVSDIGNTTRTNLLANGVWNGSSTSIVGKDIGTIAVSIYTDSASASNGFIIYFSANGTIWSDSTRYSISASTAVTYYFLPKMAYYKLKYTNGTKATGVLSIQTITYSQTLSPSVSVSATVTPPTGGFATNTKLDSAVTVLKVFGSVAGGMYWDTTSTSGDTVTTPVGSIKWKLTLGTDDTIYVSHVGTYPANDKGVLLPNQSYTWYLNSATYPKFYYKQYGTGNANVQVIKEDY